MAAISGYRWADGTQAAGVVLSTTYAIENFPGQTDMNIGRGGVAWLQPSIVVVTPAVQLLDSLDGTRDGYGGAVIDWAFAYLSPDMVRYLRDTFFNSTDYSRANTIRTWNRQSGLWEEYTATALWPKFEITGGLERRGGGLRDFPIRFIKGTKIA